MKKSTFIAVVTAAILFIGLSLAGNAQVVISQVYGGGGNTGATYKNDFIELFNRGTSPVTINGWSVQYSSATGSTWATGTTAIPATPTITLAPGQYYLIQEASGGTPGATLPTADLTGSINLSGTTGKVALVNTTTALTGTCPTGGSIVDFVGFGTTPNCYEGTAAAPAPSNTTADIRASGGCTDNNQNSADFATGTPNPRNTATTLAPCGGGPTLTATPTPLTFSYTVGGGPTASQTITINGSSLSPASGNITITGTADYEVSSDNSLWGGTATISYTLGTVTSASGYIRLKVGLTAGTYNETVVVSGGTATAQNIVCNGTVNTPGPVIGIVGTVAAFGSQNTGTTSAEKTYLVTGSYLTAPIIVAPPAGFEVSTTTGTGFVGSSSYLTLTPSSGSVSQTIYVHFVPTLVQAYSGNITHTSTGAAEKDVAVSGTGISGPLPLPMYEEFNYAPGALLTNNGWVAHSGSGTNPITVATSSISYAGYLSSSIGNEITMTTSGEDDNRAFAQQTTGNVYASFLVYVTASNTTGDYFLHFTQSSGSGAAGFFGRVFIKKDASTTNFAFGISKYNGTAIYSGFNYTLNTTYLVVLKYAFNTGTTNDDVTYLFVNPSLNSPEPSPLLTSTDVATDATSITAIALRQGTAANAPTLRLDGIRISNNWTDIVGATGTPTITAGTVSGFGNQTINTISAEKTYNVAGSGLSANIVITPPVGFEISTTSGSGFIDNPNSITLTQSGGIVNTTPIYVRFVPTVIQVYSGNIVHTSTGATEVDIAVTGNGFTGLPEPTNHVTNFTAGTTTGTTIPLTWTDAIGGTPPENYLIKGSSVAFATIADPVDGVPEANSALVQNVAQGVGAYTFTGLNPGMSYYFKIYPYTNSGINIDYKTTVTVPQATANTLITPGLALYENFNYAPPAYIGGNTVIPSSSNNWVTHSGSGGTIDVQNANLSYTGLQASTGYMIRLPGDNIGTPRDVNRVLPSMNIASVLYYSTLVNVEDSTQLAATADYFMHFGETSGSSVTFFGGRLGIRKVSSTAYRLSISNTSGGTPTYTDYAQDLSYATTYFVVVKYDRSTSPTTAYLWVNPTSFGGTEPVGSVSNNSGTGTFTAFASICLRNGSSTPKVDIDEIRVGTTWADVTPAGVTTTTLNLKVFLESLYPDPLNPGKMRYAQGDAGNEFTGSTVDVITVELHLQADGSLIYTHDANLNDDGTASLEIPAENSGSYFIYIKHRNSIKTSTSTALSFATGPVNYDFTTAASMAFGDNQKDFGNGKFGIYAGDVDQDGGIGIYDMGLIENASNNFASGYLPEDVNGDGSVGIYDMGIIENNSNAFVGMSLPF